MTTAPCASATTPTALANMLGTGVLVWDSPARRSGDRVSHTRVTTTPTATTIARVHTWDHGTQRTHARRTLPHPPGTTPRDQHNAITRAILTALAY